MEHNNTTLTAIYINNVKFFMIYKSILSNKYKELIDSQVSNFNWPSFTLIGTEDIYNLFDSLLSLLNN